MIESEPDGVALPVPCEVLGGHIFSNDSRPLSIANIATMAIGPTRVPYNLDRYERIAPLYDLFDLPFEFSRYRKIRPLLFEGLRGRLLDAGVGTGRNIAYYPPEAQVVGIDISPAMLARAERRRLSLRAEVELHQMDVTNLAFADHYFDGAVAT